MVAISKDSTSDSAAFAERYGIWFPLIADADLAIAKQWVGVNDEGYAIPGVFILKPGGDIAFRRIGERKDDRVYARDLITILDEILETPASDRVAVRGGFDPSDKIQLRAGGAGGATRGAGNTDPAGSVGVAALYPLNRHLMIGPSLSALWAEASALETSALLRLRSLSLADLAEASLTIPIGVAIRLGDSETLDRAGLHLGARLGLQFAVWPSAAPFIELEVAGNRFGTSGGEAFTQSRLMLRLGVAWMP